MKPSIIEKMKTAIDKYFNIISIFFILSIILIIFFGQTFFDNSFDKPLEISMSFIAIYLGLLGDHMASIKKMIPRNNIYICADQLTANDHFSEIIKDQCPNNVDLIGYSGANVKHLIDNLLKRNCKIRLLVHHPYTALSESQTKKISVQVDTILKDNSGKDIEIKFYNETVSIRGMNFENKLINVGWYSYDARDKAVQSPQIHGRDNPLITLKIGDPGFDDLLKMFNTTFANLWAAAEHVVKIEEPENGSKIKTAIVHHTAEPQSLQGMTQCVTSDLKVSNDGWPDLPGGQWALPRSYGRR